MTSSEVVRQQWTGRSTVRAGGRVVAVEWAAATHPGLRRRLNEDSVGVSSPVFIVADGMGGHASGEVASSLAVGAMASLGSESAVLPFVLARTITETNRLIHDRADGGERAMGTTLTGLAITDVGEPAVTVFNVGDSRTYRLAAGELKQMTVDHSHVQEMVDAGKLSSAEAATHPERNVVTRALGVEAFVEPDLFTHAVVVGDRWMSCSDGLTGELDLSTIKSRVAAGSALEACDALITATLESPARDNVTVLVVDIIAVEELQRGIEANGSSTNDITQPNGRLRAAGTARSGGDNEPATLPAGLIDVLPADLRDDSGEPSAAAVPPVLIDTIPAGELLDDLDGLEDDRSNG